MTYNEILKNKKHLHFIGVGGSGMLPIVQILLKEGYFISGSDNNESDTLDIARSLGVKIFMGQKAENIDGADLIVYSAAIMQDNPELIAAKNSGVLLLERSEMLGAITSRFDNTVCVAGTHGKTTVTAMLTQILLNANLDPTAVIGGKLPSIGGNGRVGDSDIMVCEACEFANTFLRLSPDISVILNIDHDHLDFFKTFDNLIASFRKFCEKTTKLLIINGDDENTVNAVSNINKKVITFGINEGNNYRAVNVQKLDGIKKTFDILKDNEKLCTVTINVPGTHNITNALAACTAALHCGLSPDEINLENFKGAGRRFEILGEINSINPLGNCAVQGRRPPLYEDTAREDNEAMCSFREGLSINNNQNKNVQQLLTSPCHIHNDFVQTQCMGIITIADDYAHHPLEIECTLKTAKELNYNRVIAIHQPFTFSRTANMLDEFAKALSIADVVILSPIMGSREKNTFGIKSEDLAAKIKNCFYYETFEEISNNVMNIAKPGDLIITLGCGDIYKVGKFILKNS